MHANTDAPDPLEKRNVLASKDVSREEVLRLAAAFLERGALTDACNFFDKAEDADGLEKVKRRAIELGNAAVLSDMQRSRHIQVTTEDWRAAGERAVRDRKFAYAALAFARSGDEDDEEAARQRIPGAPKPEEQAGERET